MVDKSPITLFGVPSPDPMTTLMGIVADISAMKQNTNATDQRLGNIEQAIIKNQELIRAVTSLQATVTANTADVQELRARCETIDKTVEVIGTHDLRIKTVEKELITSGELRMKAVEDKIRETESKKKGEKELMIKAILGVLSAAIIGGGGYAFLHYVVPYLGLH